MVEAGETRYTLFISRIRRRRIVAFIVIGLWLVGAPLLAGPWLPGPLRWLGALGGLGFVLTGVGLLAGGTTNPLTWLGGVGFELVFPIWALLMSRIFRSRIPSG